MARPRLLRQKNYPDELCRIEKHPNTFSDTTVGDSAEVKLMIGWSMLNGCLYMVSSFEHLPGDDIKRDPDMD